MTPRAVAPVPQAALPERAVQFGTGALLRGLVDPILDKANERGFFGGRVVAIGSTGSGREDTINNRSGQYALVVRGLRDGSPVDERRTISVLSRALRADREWDQVLACARNPDLQLVFSNTTEIGIALDPHDATTLLDGVPRSFPARLTRFLYERATAFDFARDRGVDVIPCELIESNGDTLRDMVAQCAQLWRLPAEFHDWLGAHVRFCNTLVDRIVVSEGEDLTTVCEPYRLLAIEGDAALRRTLRFTTGDFGAVVVDDVAPYRLRKVRLLNGLHTTLVYLALLSGCETVRDAIQHERIGPFIRQALFDELLPTVNVAGAGDFARDVLERLANPFIEHRLRDIAVNGAAKMRIRVVPAIIAYSALTGRPPAALALGVAAFLRYTYPGISLESARSMCSDATLWGADLGAIPGLSDAVVAHAASIGPELSLEGVR